MSRKAVLSVCIVASAGVTTAVAARGAVVQAIEVFLLHVFFLIDVWMRPPSEGVDRETRGQGLWGKILMLSLVFLPLYPLDMSTQQLWAGVVGLGLTSVGAMVALWGRGSLGRMGTPNLVIIKEPTLYTAGLYRFIRHPIYAGFSLAFLGHQVAFLSIYGLMVWLLFQATFMRKRIQVEEEMLVEQFQGAYLDYRKHTWKMFPYVY